MAPLFERLVELAYDAPLTPDGWRPFLHALCEHTGASAAGLKWLAYSPERFHMVDSGFDPVILRSYAEYYGRIDPWSHVPLAGDADAFGDEMLPRRELEASEFYQDFCRLYEFHDLHKIMLAKSEERQISIGLFKPSRVTEPEVERDLTRRLAPHVRRALSLAHRIADSEDARGAMTDALDLTSAVVFFLDHRGRVKSCTAAAERIIAARDGLELVRGELHALHPDDDRQLAAHFAGMTDAAAAIVRRSPTAAPYRVFAVPRPRDGVSQDIAMLAIVTETPTPRATEAVLRHGYGLTSAELRVALLVGRGASPTRAAAELEVSSYTVLAHLREIFAKTGVERQAELVELLERLEHA
ncbi:MAG: helix-turn-helix transcriptional regulator [Kofleriaceae bacterium]